MSTLRSNRGDELACDAVLFGLDATEASELEALAYDDEQLALELAAAAVALAEFERAGDGEPIPTKLAERILAARAPVVAEVLPPAADRVRPLPVRRPATAYVGWALAAAAIVLAIAGWSRRPSDSVATPQSTSAVRESLLGRADAIKAGWTKTTDEAAASASGDVVWHAATQSGVMRFDGLAPNDPALFQYQLWIFDETRDEAHPVDGGVFDVTARGEVLVPIAAKLHVGKPKLFAVTVEKPGGVVVSKRARIVVTAAPPT